MVCTGVRMLGVPFHMLCPLFRMPRGTRWSTTTRHARPPRRGRPLPATCPAPDPA